MQKRFQILSFFVCAAMTVGAFIYTSTASAQNYSRNLETISQLNRIDPRQNPEFEDSADVLGRRVIDSKNKVIGEVRDIVLSDRGGISFLNVEFNRLRLNSSIYLNYSSMSIEPVSNGYALGFDDDQIEQIYPTLLAQTETASGEDDESFSVRSVVGAAVKKQDGSQIGVVDDVLFGGNGGRASAILVKLTQGTLRGDMVAVPFNNPSFESAGSKKNIILSDDMAQAVTDFAKIN